MSTAVRDPGASPKLTSDPAPGQQTYAAWIELGLSAKTVKHHHRMLHEAFEHGVGWQLLVMNPAATAKPPRPERKEVRALSLDQLHALLAAAAAFPYPYPLIVSLAAATGMRQGNCSHFAGQNATSVPAWRVSRGPRGGSPVLESCTETRRRIGAVGPSGSHRTRANCFAATA